jgi:uncharacterized protein (DUF433 family)
LKISASEVVMAETQTKWQYLERDPKSSYRQLSIKGRRVKARTLYGRFMSAEDPQTIEQIAADWNLPIEAVKEAIAYCQSDPPEIRQDFLVEEVLMEASGMNDPNYKYNPQPKPIPPEEYARIRRMYRDENLPG